mmetsp:Transcript_47105/g.135692  ORF Transcript_47105/g.135692 Transcript_47105/m.135692 type:complete len:255 (-) Transcript_47105:297-1061(-)
MPSSSRSALRIKLNPSVRTVRKSHRRIAARIAKIASLAVCPLCSMTCLWIMMSRSVMTFFESFDFFQSSIDGADPPPDSQSVPGCCFHVDVGRALVKKCSNIFMGGFGTSSEFAKIVCGGPGKVTSGATQSSKLALMPCSLPGVPPAALDADEPTSPANWPKRFSKASSARDKSSGRCRTVHRKFTSVLGRIASDGAPPGLPQARPTDFGGGGAMPLPPPLLPAPFMGGGAPLAPLTPLAPLPPLPPLAPLAAT